MVEYNEALLRAKYPKKIYQLWARLGKIIIQVEVVLSLDNKSGFADAVRKVLTWWRGSSLHWFHQE